MAKKTLQVCLNEFCDLADISFVTKQAFSKARKKISAKTFILLNSKLLEEFYTDNIFQTWNGYRLLAIDGSDKQLPQTEGFKSIFGAAKNQRGSTLAMAKISYAYDVLNHLVLDAKISVCKASERNLAVAHIEDIKKLTHDKTNDLYLFDRGYPSLGLLFYLSQEKKDFVMRCSVASCFGSVKKAFEAGKEDLVIRLYAKDANDDQIKELKTRVPNLDRKNSYIDIRMVVVTLDTGEKELLITSLLNVKAYPKKVFKELYNHRWKIEESYKLHKVGFELENFSGVSELAIEQEFYAVIFTANMASLLVQEAENELKEERKVKELKYEYKINRRIAITYIRKELLKGLLDKENNMEALCTALKEAFKKNICPVRPNRKFDRRNKGRLKYGLTMRRCI